jgi:hypothetical protein
VGRRYICWNSFLQQQLSIKLVQQSIEFIKLSE